MSMLTSLRYPLLFLAIQAVNLPLAILGIPIVGVSLLLLNREPPWLWNNSDDKALLAGMSRPKRFVYLALRNPVGNLRHLPGVSKSGRPLWYWTRVMLNKQFYIKMGWMSDGYPACSFGGGRGY